MVSPGEDEYSRVTDPGRYRILSARVRVWAEVLGAVPGVTVADVGGAELEIRGAFTAANRGVRIAPARPHAAPLWLLEHEVQDPAGALTGVQVGAGAPAFLVTWLPHCGCDACDDGSERLLDDLDEAILRVVEGPLVLLRGRDWEAEWSPRGESWGGSGRGPNHERVMGWCRALARGEEVRLPARVDAVVGGPWFGPGLA